MTKRKPASRKASGCVEFLEFVELVEFAELLGSVEFKVAIVYHREASRSVKAAE